jgi:hypothetical protein
MQSGLTVGCLCCMSLLTGGAAAEVAHATECPMYALCGAACRVDRILGLVTCQFCHLLLSPSLHRMVQVQVKYTATILQLLTYTRQVATDKHWFDCHLAYRQPGFMVLKHQGSTHFGIVEDICMYHSRTRQQGLGCCSGHVKSWYSCQRLPDVLRCS